MYRQSALALLIYIGSISIAQPVHAQQAPEPRPADRALENGDWQAALEGYRALLEEDPTNGVTWLRIAQAQRGLGQHGEALESLELARDGEGPPAMIDLERARNLAALGDSGEALAALETADHFGLRALSPFEEAAEFETLRREDRFDRVYQNVRSRIYPCEALESASAFDFWLGSWAVRLA
ncbi:MAG: tetratricopeptide repeat protein, partial [Gammaproteobacteria bacterium]